MRIKNHLKESLKIQNTQAPKTMIFLNGLTGTLPLLIGIFTNQIGASIFGTLVAILLVLNDHLGDLRHRLVVFTLTFAMMSLGLWAGITLQWQPILYSITFLVISYWLGLMGGFGAELERALMFGLFQLLAGYSTKNLNLMMAPLLIFCLIGFAGVILGALILDRLVPRAQISAASLRESFKLSLTLDKEKHLYALIFCTTVMISLAFVHFFQVDHGYWAVGTILLLLKPDPNLSLQRITQRLIGTLAGVLITELMILSLHNTPLMPVMIVLLCLLAPWGLFKNYWVGTLFYSVLILLLLEMATPEQHDTKIPWIRLSATAIGCGLTHIGVILVFALKNKKARI